MSSLLSIVTAETGDFHFIYNNLYITYSIAGYFHGKLFSRFHKNLDVFMNGKCVTMFIN